MRMENRIDPLIAERAPWLWGSGAARSVLRSALNKALSYEQTVTLAAQLQNVPASAIMAYMYARLGQHVHIQGLDNIPRNGPALIVANHPTGIADGIILHGALANIRPDAYFFANKDILRVFPQMADMIAPVEWRLEKRSHGQTRQTLDFVRTATQEGRIGVIFPSGRLAKRRGLQLHERPWMASAAMLARKFDLPVVPINISARNSALFYLMDILHPSLRDITLFHETLNKHRQPFSLTIGEPISPSALPKSSHDGIALLRDATLSLAAKSKTGVGAIRPSRALVRF